MQASARVMVGCALSRYGFSASQYLAALKHLASFVKLAKECNQAPAVPPVRSQLGGLDARLAGWPALTRSPLPLPDPFIESISEKIVVIFYMINFVQSSFNCGLLLFTRCTSVLDAQFCNTSFIVLFLALI